MNKAKVFVQGSSYNKTTAQTFEVEGKYSIVNKLSDSDIVVWTGGEDINPSIYGEERLPQTDRPSGRDIGDLEAIKEALELNKFMVGICRGAQLLNCVPNGGKLWQDVDNHNYSSHRTFDCVTGTWLWTNSIHHQAMIPGPGAEILCWSMESTRKERQDMVWSTGTRPKGSAVLEKDKDIEGLWYPETRSLLVQFHPEFGHSDTTDYFFQILMSRYFWGKEKMQEVA